jgi:hypothetical protein
VIAVIGEALIDAHVDGDLLRPFPSERFALATDPPASAMRRGSLAAVGIHMMVL